MAGIQELLIIAFIVILLFGSNKLPQLVKYLSRAKIDFKRGSNEAIEKSVQIRKIAQNLSIATENKSDEQLLKEIEAVTRIKIFREK